MEVGQGPNWGCNAKGKKIIFIKKKIIKVTKPVMNCQEI
jgi:hypothetical protein